MTMTTRGAVKKQHTNTGEQKMGTSTINVWKSLDLNGRCQSATDMRARLDHDQVAYKQNGADRLLDKVQYATSPVRLDLVDVSVEELGFADGASFEEATTRGLSMGLELCPAQVGPELRLAHDVTDLHHITRRCAGDEVYVAMEPIDGQIFLVRDGSYSSRLEARDAAQPHARVVGKFPRSARLIFVLPKK